HIHMGYNPVKSETTVLKAARRTMGFVILSLSWICIIYLFVGISEYVKRPTDKRPPLETKSV
ncbi:unnamed protein product, partial [marine sediment metagenome]